MELDQLPTENIIEKFSGSTVKAWGKGITLKYTRALCFFFFFLIRPASKGINQSLTYWYDLGKKYLTEAHYKYPYSTLAHYKHLKWEEKKMRSMCKVHSPETRAHLKKET